MTDTTPIVKPSIDESIVPKSDGDRFRVEEDAITENPPTNKDDPDIVKVVIVNKAKISYLFTERIPDV